MALSATLRITCVIWSGSSLNESRVDVPGYSGTSLTPFFSASGRSSATTRSTRSGRSVGRSAGSRGRAHAPKLTNQRFQPRQLLPPPIVGKLRFRCVGPRARSDDLERTLDAGRGFWISCARPAAIPSRAPTTDRHGADDPAIL